VKNSETCRQRTSVSNIVKLGSFNIVKLGRPVPVDGMATVTAQIACVLVNDKAVGGEVVI
jgi:hypothetical protein